MNSETGRVPAFKRRSSIIQQAKKDGMSLQGGDILRGLPPNLQQTIARISNGTISSLGGKSTYSALPTPQGPANARFGKGAPNSGQNGSSIPRPKAGNLGISSGISKSLFNLAASNNRGKSSTSTARATTSAKPKLNLMKRSTSMDFTNSSLAGMMTPMCTPQFNNALRSPGSLKSWGSQSNLTNRREAGGSNFKLPGTKDVKILNGMMAYVHNFFVSRGFTSLPENPTDLKKITSSMYINLVKMVGEELIDEKFFVMKEKEDVAGKIVEMSFRLKYPGPISKSSLKSANAQHTWPSCLTFLCWLCCHAESAYEAEPETPMSDLLDAAFPRIAVPHYKNIYYAQLLSKNDAAVLENELIQFREKVSRELMGESCSTLEELQEMKEEKLDELATVNEIPDPTKEALESMQVSRAKLDECRAKIENASDRIAFYKNRHTLKSKAESLRIELHSAQSKVNELKIQVKSQPMDKKTADKFTREINDMKDQRECLQTINHNLEKNLNEKHSTLHDLNIQFRHVLEKFTVVETYNACLSNLKVDGLAVKVNPFNAEELDVWLNTVSKSHDKTEKATQAWLEAVKGDLEKIQDAYIRAEEELSITKRQLETKRVMTKSGHNFHKTEEKQRADTIKCSQDELNQLRNLLSKKEKELEELRKKWVSTKETQSSLNKRRQELLQTKRNWDTKIEENYGKYLIEEAKLCEIYTDEVIHYRNLIAEHKKEQEEIAAKYLNNAETPI